MIFRDEINLLENRIKSRDYLFKNGKIPILITAVHTVYQEHKDKFAEPYTGGIAQYVANRIDGFYAIKAIDNGIDSNSTDPDEFKDYLLSKIRDENIKLIIDLHGAKKEREFNIEIGTLNGLTADLTVIKSLEYCFIKNGIQDIAYNNPFKGGGITQSLFANTDLDIIQIEINYSYRNKYDLEKCEKVCNALIDFSKIFANFN